MVGVVQRRAGGRVDRIRVRLIASTMAVAGVVGAVVGLAVVAVDRLLLTPPPLELVSTASARTLHGAVLGGLITVAVFSLWMRTVVVGLVSDQFSPRTLSTFLDDAFQRHVLGAMASGVATVSVILLGLPADDLDPAPLVGTGGVVAAALAGLGGVLAAIHHATRSLSLPEIVGRLYDQAVDVLDRQPTEHARLTGPPTMARPLPVLASGTGWVVDTDVDGMLEALPPGGSLRLQTRVGDFVTPRSTVALVSTEDATVHDADLDAIVRCVSLARTRSPDLDLSFAIGQLVDVAVHALRGSTDTATAHEALVHLGALLERVVERGLPYWHRADEEGRVVVDEVGWDAADHVQLCAERLREPAAQEQETALDVLRMLGKVRRAAAGVDDRAVVSEVGRQVEILRRLVDRRDASRLGHQRLDRLAEDVLAVGASPSRSGGDGRTDGRRR